MSTSDLSLYIPTYMQALVCLCTCAHIHIYAKEVHFLYPFTCSWIHRLFLLFSCRENCYEYGYIKVSVHAFCLLGMCPEVGLLSHVVILFLIFEKLPYSDGMIKHLQCKTILISLYAHHHVLLWVSFCFVLVLCKETHNLLHTKHTLYLWVALHH